MVFLFFEIYQMVLIIFKSKNFSYTGDLPFIYYLAAFSDGIPYLFLQVELNFRRRPFVDGSSNQVNWIDKSSFLSLSLSFLIMIKLIINQFMLQYPAIKSERRLRIR